MSKSSKESYGRVSLIFVLSTASLFSYSQNRGKDSVNAIFDPEKVVFIFEKVFKQDSVSLCNKNNVVLFCNVISTVPQLGVAYKIPVSRRDFPAVMMFKKYGYVINGNDIDEKGRFVYINNTKSGIDITYSSQYKLHM